MSLVTASGHGRFWRKSAKIIRFARQGCTNRPFYQIVVMEVSLIEFCTISTLFMNCVYFSAAKVNRNQ